MKKSTVILLVLCVLIAFTAIGIMVALSREETPPDPLPESGSGAVFDFDAETVSAVSWKLGDTSVALLCVNGTWIHSDDPKMPIDPKGIAEILSSFRNLSTETVLEQLPPEEYATYGFGDSFLFVSDRDGAHQLNIGKTNAITGEYYVSTEEGTVYLVDAEPFVKLGRVTAADLLFTASLDVVTAATLTECTFTVAGATYCFRYHRAGSGSDGEWTFSENGKEEVPFSDRDGILLRDLTTARYGTLCTWDFPESNGFGMDGTFLLTVRYRKTVTISGEDGKNRYEERDFSYTLELGEGTDGALYAHPAGETTVYTLSPETLLSDLLTAVKQAVRN